MSKKEGNAMVEETSEQDVGRNLSETNHKIKLENSTQNNNALNVNKFVLFNVVDSRL